jgi:hypothetical protein
MSENDFECFASTRVNTPVDDVTNARDALTSRLKLPSIVPEDRDPGAIARTTAHRLRGSPSSA